jgi:hypothetical protein
VNSMVWYEANIARSRSDMNAPWSSKSSFIASCSRSNQGLPGDRRRASRPGICRQVDMAGTGVRWAPARRARLASHYLCSRPLPRPAQTPSLRCPCVIQRRARTRPACAIARPARGLPTSLQTAHARPSITGSRPARPASPRACCRLLSQRRRASWC